MAESAINGVSTKEHLETVLSRVEEAVRTELNDIKANYVQRSEYHTQVTGFYRELDRMERDNLLRTTELKEDIKSLKEDVVNEYRKNLALVGVVLGIIEFVVRVVI